ncbi:MAG: 4Fe-4S dicluster domain-containing protein [Bacteroidota bacterium]
MSKFPLQDISHESDLDKDFGKLIAKNAHGEKLFGCIQCGNCSAACPLSIYMDYTPRKVIAMVRAGFKKEVLSNNTVWLCASCYNCTVECPKGIKITEVMYAIKREAIKNKAYPKNFPIPIMASTFFKEVKSRGRINELYLLLKYYMRYNIFKSIGYASLGIKLFMTGRILPFEKGTKNKEQLKRIVCSKEI